MNECSSGIKLALFGGAFDPVHNAHLAAATAAANEFQLQRILFVPAHHPPHKGGITNASYDDRVRMLQLACAVDARFEVSRLEEGTERSYSIDTIEKVRDTLTADDELFFIIGGDAFAEISTWRRWQDVVQNVTFLVVSRPGYSYDVPSGAKVETLKTLNLAISSTQVRRDLAVCHRTNLVPESVMKYIDAHSLYSVSTS